MPPRQPGHVAVPIPYAGHHVGPRRLLSLTLRRGLLGVHGAYVSIDGWTGVLPWGTAVFEVPADRPVMISIYQAWMVGLATTVLMPQEPPMLEYRSPRANGFPGDIGAPGTTRARGAGCLFALLAPVPVLLIIFFAIVLGFLL